MVNKPKRIGTDAESGVVEYLRGEGFPQVERLALQGAVDRGDITGCPGIVWEVKAGRSQSWPAWLRETETERRNADADYGILVVKPPGLGRNNVHRWQAAMYLDDFMDLTIAAGLHTGLGHELSPRNANAVVSALLKDMHTAIDRTENSHYFVVVRTNGVRDRRFWRAVTHLSEMCFIVRTAGYGGGYGQETPDRAGSR